MSDSPTIRLATLADLDAVCEIYNHEVRTSRCTFDTDPMEGECAIGWFNSHPSDRFPLTVCESNSVIVGWASLSSWSVRCAYDKAAETSVYVHKDARGQGLSSLLYADLIARARALGYRVLLARVALPNAASERLHESVGFQEIGIMRNIGEKFGELVDVRLMDLQLAETEPGAG